MSIRKFPRGFYFRETYMRSFVEMKSSQNGEITLSITDKVSHALVAIF